MFKIHFLLILLLSFSSINAQNNITPVTIGTPVPNANIVNVRNYLKTSFNIADFKGKLIIFDFWALNCIPCIKAFPKLDSLQNQFGDKIKIILVTKTPVQELDDQYKIIEKKSALHRYKPKLISVIQDTVLSSLFPYATIPNIVWVNSEGVLQAMTGGSYVTSENIKKMLLDHSLKLPLKNDFLSFDWRKPSLAQLFIQNEENLKYYSSILKEVKRGGSQEKVSIDSANKTIRITRTGDLLSFYGDIFSGYRAGNPFESAYYDFGKRVILNVSDSSRFFYMGKDRTIEYDNWKSNNSYTYETVLPLMDLKEVYKHYEADINKFFKLEAKYEEREMKCLLLVRTSNVDKLKAKNSGRFESGASENGTFHFTNGKPRDITRILSENNRNIPQTFIDSTNYNGQIDIVIKSPLTNLEAVKKELNNNYDLDLLEKIQKVTTLVISDKKK